MALTKSFKALVQKRAARDPSFREALLREGINTMLAGDIDTGKAILEWLERYPAAQEIDPPLNRTGM